MSVFHESPTAAALNTSVQFHVIWEIIIEIEYPGVVLIYKIQTKIYTHIGNTVVWDMQIRAATLS